MSIIRNCAILYDTYHLLLVVFSNNVSILHRLQDITTLQCTWLPTCELAKYVGFDTTVKTSGYAMVVHGRPKTPKIEVFWGSPSPQGSHSPYILRDTTRPGHVTCVLVWCKSDRRRLRKTLHKQTNRQTNKQTDRQTDRHYENNGHLAVNQLYDTKR